MSRSVLLLRAVNLGAKNKVPMARLRELIAERTDLGEVQTYIASGNIICDTPKDAATACATVRALIAEEFDVDTPVIARTHHQLVTALRQHPFQGGAENLVHAMFLEAEPAAGAADALRERLVPGEEIALIGADLWISYSDGGVHSTKLSKAVLDRALAVAGTARNLRTARALAELTEAG